MNKHGFLAPDRKPVETVEELRKIWESDREWISRRKFLDKHWGTIQPFELDSLSSVWFNNLVLGWRYPKATIERVKSLAEGLEVDNLTMLRGVLKQFVKSAEDDNNEVNDDEECSEVPAPKKPTSPPKSIVGMNPFKKRKIGSIPTTPIVIADTSPERERSSSVVKNIDKSQNSDHEHISSVSRAKEKLNYRNFVAPHSSEKSSSCVKTDSETCNNYEKDKNDSKKLSKKAKKVEKLESRPTNEATSPPQKLNFVPFKRSTSPLSEVVPVKKSFIPVVFDLESTSKPNRKKDKTVAVNTGNEFESNSQYSNASLLPNRNSKTKKRKKNPRSFIGKFVLLFEEGQALMSSNAKTILVRFTNFNKVDYEFVNTLCEKSIVKSEYYLNGQLFSEGFGSNRKIAENEAAFEAVKLLEELVPVIQILQLQDKSADYVPEGLGGYKENASHAQNSMTSSQSTALEPSNMGYKLLAKMGWTSGTGLGKEGQGRVDPVEASVANRSRQGLGCEIVPKFLREPGISKKLATQIIDTYIESCSEEPITFSSAFTNEDRKILHFVAGIASKKYNVKLVTKSYGVEPNRYLTISRALTGEQLFDMAQQAEQKFGRYKVLSVGTSGQ